MTNLISSAAADALENLFDNAERTSADWPGKVPHSAPADGAEESPGHP